MSIELDRPRRRSGGVHAERRHASHARKDGTLVHVELADIVEQSLAGLKTIDAETSVPSQAAWRSALDLRGTSRASRSRRDPETARGDAMCLIIAICGSRGRAHGG